MKPSLFRTRLSPPRVARALLLVALVLRVLPAQALWANPQTAKSFNQANLTSATLGAVAAMAPNTVTFNYTGMPETWQVPAGVTSILIEAWGAQGGNAAVGGTGGLGGLASGTLAVTPGQILNIFVGGQNGFNGGGTGAANGNTSFGGASASNAPNGGGASDIRVGGVALANRVIVAGGGGGAGENGNWPGCQVAGPAGNGGNGGGLTANDGTFGVSTPCGCGGGGGDKGVGGSQIAGGAAGGYHGSTNCLRNSWAIGSAGALGLGGNGSTAFHNGTGGGGGGGGGFYGGGAGGSGSDTTAGGGGGGGSSYLGGVTSGTTTPGVQTGNGLVKITYDANPTQPPTLNVQASGRPNNAGIGDPAVCLDPGGLVGVAATVTNPNNAALASTFTATLPGGLTAVAGTCTADVNPGGCTIAANGGSVSWNGNLAAGQTVNIVYRARTDANAGQGSSFTINNTATVGGVPANLAYTFTLNCPNITNTRVSDQKAGSVLVFPYYTSTVGGGSDTRMTISNISNAASTAANQAYVHLFFIDGTTCAQADLFLCLTPNASFSFKASEYDPGNTGYLLAVAVDRNGVPVQNNVLIGNAFVTTPTLADNYGAESFWANTFAVATVTGNTATLYFDQTGYDAVPKQFVAEVQSPLDAAGQQIITAGLSGNLTTSTITGAAQVGTGLAFNEQEKFVSFQGWLLGTCQARATIATNSPRVPNGLGNLINTGQSGSLKFNVGAAVGLLLTPRTATWKGIRTLHKTQTTTTSLTIPIFVPVC